MTTPSSTGTHQADKERKCNYLAIPPPHLASHAPGATSECCRLVCHSVGFIDEELDALASTQDLFDVLHHDVLDLVELRLGTCQVVGGWTRVVGVHELGDGGREGALKTMCRKGGEGGNGCSR